MCWGCRWGHRGGGAFPPSAGPSGPAWTWTSSSNNMFTTYCSWRTSMGGISGSAATHPSTDRVGGMWQESDSPGARPQGILHCSCSLTRQHFPYGRCRGTTRLSGTSLRAWLGGTTAHAWDPGTSEECRLREGDWFPQGRLGGRGRVRARTHVCLFQNSYFFFIPKPRDIPRKRRLRRRDVELCSGQKAWDAFGMAQKDWADPLGVMRLTRAPTAQILTAGWPRRFPLGSGHELHPIHWHSLCETRKHHLLGCTWKKPRVRKPRAAWPERAWGAVICQPWECSVIPVCPAPFAVKWG